MAKLVTFETAGVTTTPMVWTADENCIIREFQYNVSCVVSFNPTLLFADWNAPAVNSVTDQFRTGLGFNTGINVPVDKGQSVFCAFGGGGQPGQCQLSIESISAEPIIGS